MLEDSDRPRSETPEGAGEWLELGPAGPVRPWRHRRPMLIGAAVLAIMVLIASGVIIARPFWLARHQQLDQAQIRAALARLDLDDPSVRGVQVDPRITEADRCAALGGPVPTDEAEAISAVEAIGIRRGERAKVTVLALLLDTPEAAGRAYRELEEALADEACHRSRNGSQVAVDAPPQPDRQLGYQIVLPAPDEGSGSNDLRYRVRILRYGNTVSYVAAFGPTGAADLATDLAGALDEAFADG